MHRQDLPIDPGADVSVEAELPPARFAADLYQVVARLSLDGRLVDQMTTGFVVEDTKVQRSAAGSRFVDNYFTRGERPVFLFGSDDYSHTYRSAFENPLTWAEDHRAARDIGLQVYENLQYSQRGPTLDESDWRSFPRHGAAHAEAQFGFHARHVDRFQRSRRRRTVGRSECRLRPVRRTA